MCTPIAHAIAGMTIVEADRRWGRGELHAGWRWAATGAILACLPDIDKPLTHLFGKGVAFLNVAQGWGPRRGLTHTLLFALVVTLLAAGVLRVLYKIQWADLRRHGMLFCCAMASHPVMDALTHAGNAIPFFWPLSDQRFMSPWPLLPVVPYASRTAGLPLLTDPLVWFAVAMEILAMGSLYLAVRIRSHRGRWWMGGVVLAMALVYVVRIRPFG